MRVRTPYYTPNMEIQMGIGAEALLMLILQKNDLELSNAIIPAEAYCLSLNIYEEARGEPLEGKVAVANVVRNRVESDKYPNTYCEVVKQRRGNICQFSWYCDSRIRKPYFRSMQLPDAQAFKFAVEISLKIMDNIIIDNTEGSTHFHATYVSPYWNKYLVQTVQYGEHIFYKYDL